MCTQATHFLMLKRTGSQTALPYQLGYEAQSVTSFVNDEFWKSRTKRPMVSSSTQLWISPVTIGFFETCSRP